jgi:hypothetical protein
LFAFLAVPTIAVAAHVARAVAGRIEVQFRHCVFSVAQWQMYCVVGH